MLRIRLVLLGGVAAGALGGCYAMRQAAISAQRIRVPSEVSVVWLPGGNASALQPVGTKASLSVKNFTHENQRRGDNPRILIR